MSTEKQVSPQGLKWYQDAKFGMFIHWGLYSILAKEEWIMHTGRIPVEEYEKLVSQFNPTKFNADEWVSIAADAGQKYILPTSRHHDGFSMYDTALSDYKVTNTPFKRDPLAELANACAKRGDVKLGFYSSLLDWHHPAYRFRAESGLAWSDYIGFLHGQVRELCTNFGEIVEIWFDGDWPHHTFDETNQYFKPGGSFEYDALYDLIHTLQPNAVVHNNRHEKPLPGEDVQGFEQDLPGANTAGFNPSEVYDMPLEVCMTINGHWGYSADDHDLKSARQLIHYLVRGASAGANYLLNVGPTPLGEILPVQAQRLREVGTWLAKQGESVYGTRKGAFAPTADVVSTSQGTTHYLHSLNVSSESVNVPGVPNLAITQAALLDGSTVALSQADGKLVVAIPAGKRDAFDTVIKLT